MTEHVTIRSWMQSAYHILYTAEVEDIAVVLHALLSHHLNTDRAWLLAHPEAEISSSIQSQLEDDISQIKDGMPLPYILGFRDFYGHRFRVTPHTLIPRPETEIMVELALEWLKKQPGWRYCRYIDVGTGSGCIPISILSAIPDLSACATDLSYQALQIARDNSKQLSDSQKIDFICADLLNFSGQRWNLVTANLPYIPSEKLKTLPVAQYEPISALDGGADGLDLIRKLLCNLQSTLAFPGLALFEIEIDQSNEVRKFAEKIFPNGKIELIKDLAGIDRILQIEQL